MNSDKTHFDPRDSIDDILLYDDPVQVGILLQRNPSNSQVLTNVPHTVVHHSPTGYEWGYCGSGPADLALNILELVLNRIAYKGSLISGMWSNDPIHAISWQLHQEFKREVIAGVPKQGMVLPFRMVEEWIFTRLADDGNFKKVAQ